jgi:amino acid permease
MDEEQIEEIRNMLNPKKEGNESSNSGTQEEASGSQNPPEPSLEAIIEKQFGSLIENDEGELQRTNSGRPKKRKWSQRTFSRMNRGSLRGSIFTLINTAMGLGMLAMPQCVGQIGITASVVFFIATAMIVTWSLDSLNYCSHALGGSQSYADAVKRLTGRKFALFFALFLIESIVISTVALVVASAEFIGTSLGYIFPSTIDFFYENGEIGRENEKWASFALVRFLLCIATGWLTFFKDLTSLRYLTVIGFSLMLYLIVVLLVQTPEYYSHNHTQSNYVINWTFWDNSYTGWTKALLAFLKFIFAYDCHVPLINVRAELQSLTFRRMKKVTDRSVWIMGLSYIVICVCGILTCGSNAPALIFSRKALNPRSDYFMQLGLFLFAWYMMLRVPQRLMISRQIMIVFKIGPKNKPSKLLFYFMTTLNVAIVTFLAVFLSNIAALIDLISSFNGCFVIVTVPGILLFCAMPWSCCKDPMQKTVFVFNIIVTTLVTLMGVAGTAITIAGYFGFVL